MLLTGSGVGAALLIKSPAQAAADTRPPAADVLTAPVERQVLTSTLVTRGQVTADQTVDIIPTASGGTSGAAVVTKLPLKAGDQVSAGVPVLEVSGRPVFPLQGDLPVYRDLKPGATGQDVVQLQGALRALGFGTGHDPAGTFGEGTKAAVTALYRAHGYDPMPSSPDGAAQVTAAEEAVTSSQRAVEDSTDELAAIRSAQAAGPTGAPSAGTDRPDPDAAAQKRVARATEDLARLRARLDTVRAETGPMVPTGEIVYLSAFPARVGGLSGRVGSIVNGKVMTISAGALVVTGKLDQADHGLVHPGQQVEVLSEISGTRATATVSAVGDAPEAADPAGEAQGQGSSTSGRPPGYRLTVRPDSPLDPQLAGQDVRLTIVAASSAGPVLVVPVTAVSADADGRTVVTVLENSQRHRVEVTTGTVGGGSVEVQPVSAGTLHEGEQVVVGIRSGRPGGDK
ncbi:peptidoglycan-binding protein [Streptomyces sp. TLI_171]|uniref:peptidoglycan-binding protein n=1 Tax=Streptomyces sp. TLI_171 TaxID=1938859 RepID=UPI00217F0131|nr:peptidoglycan-binding protein [Streptomyces sp. TLI_171]